MAAEFARVLREMRIRKSRTQAPRGVANRTTVRELRAFVSALVRLVGRLADMSGEWPEKYDCMPDCAAAEFTENCNQSSGPYHPSL